MDIYNPDSGECDSKSTCQGHLTNIERNALDLSFFNGVTFDMDDDERKCVKRKSDGKLQDEACGSSKKALCHQHCDGMLIFNCLIYVLFDNYCFYRILQSIQHS